MKTMVHTDAMHPNAKPVVYACQLSFPKAKGAVTPETWYEALIDLQETREARNAMRDVWKWERSKSEGARLAAKANADFIQKQAARPKPTPAPKPIQKERTSRPFAPVVTKECARCNASFTTSYSRKRFCSEECQRKGKNSLRDAVRKENAKNPDLASCEECQATILRSASNQKYCKECAVKVGRAKWKEQARAKYQPSRYEHTCVICSTPFVTNRKDSKACSAPCRKAHQRAISLRKFREYQERDGGAIRTHSALCVDCSASIPPQSAIKGAKRCDSCRALFKKEQYKRYRQSLPKRDVHSQCGMCQSPIISTTTRKYCDACVVIRDREARKAYRRKQAVIYKAAVAMGVTA